MISRIAALVLGAILCAVSQYFLGLTWGFIAFTSIILIIIFIRWYWRMASECYFTEWNYMASFKVWFDSSKDVFIAHRKTLDVFHERPPFAILSDSDLDRLARQFADFPNPRIAATMIRLADKKRDASSFKKHPMDIDLQDYRN